MPEEPIEKEESELWREHNAEMAQMRENRREVWETAQRELIADGYEIRKITPYQFRINGRLDIYPSNKRFHDIRDMRRGDIRGIKFRDFVRKYLG